MPKPNLIVIAGCNGSGKSTFSEILLPKHIGAFDADKRKKEHYDAFKFDFELRDQMAWNETQQEFEQLISSALFTKKDFAYETNFNSDPLFWVQRFIEAGFEINLLYFCLESMDLAKERVAIRYESGGHFVRDDEVENRYRQGFKNLDKLYEYFDTILLLEASKKSKPPRIIVHFQKESTCFISHPLPVYLEQQCPDFIKTISSKP